MTSPTTRVSSINHSHLPLDDHQVVSPIVVSTNSIAHRAFGFLSNSFSSSPLIAHIELVDNTDLFEICVALGYLIEQDPDGLDGTCNSIAHMGMDAVFVGDTDLFNTRLQKLTTLLNIHKGSVDRLVHAIHNDPILLNEFLPFFEGVALWQRPDSIADKCPDLFQKKTTPRFQEDPRSLKALLLLTESQKLQDKGGIHRVASFTGRYDVKELLSYLKHFREICEQSGTSAAIHFRITDHIFSVVYDLEKKSWFCIDANQLPIQEIKEDSNAAQFIQNGCSTSNVSFLKDVCVFDSHIFTFKNEKGKLLQKNLRQSFEKGSFKQLHQLSSKKLQLLGSKKQELFLGAVNIGNTKLIKDLLCNGVDPNFICQETDFSPLMVACQYGHVSVVRVLLANKADPNLVSEDDISALMVACQFEHVSIVRMLLANKADPNLVTKDGLSALMVACQLGRMDIVKMLLANKANPDLVSKDVISTFAVDLREDISLLLQKTLEKLKQG